MRSESSKKREKKKKEINAQRKKAGLKPLYTKNQPPGVKLTERHIEKIRTSAILNRLNSFVLDEEGEIEMAPHKVSAALGLLKKVIPDLSSTHNTDGKEKSHAEWIDELNREGDEIKAEE